MRRKINFSTLSHQKKKLLKWLFLAILVEVVLMITGAVLVEGGSNTGNIILISSVIALVITIFLIFFTTINVKK